MPSSDGGDDVLRVETGEGKADDKPGRLLELAGSGQGAEVGGQSAGVPDQAGHPVPGLRVVATGRHGDSALGTEVPLGGREKGECLDHVRVGARSAISWAAERPGSRRTTPWPCPTGLVGSISAVRALAEWITKHGNELMDAAEAAG